jgi:hypothetical protein
MLGNGEMECCSRGVLVRLDAKMVCSLLHYDNSLERYYYTHGVSLVNGISTSDAIPVSDVVIGFR